jgi:hypothetical protein
MGERTKKKKLYSESTDGKYLPLIELIEKSESLFLTSLNEIRGEMEHELYSLPKFILHVQRKNAWIEEPEIQGKKLLDLLNFYFESSLDFIEKYVSYFIGINGEEKLNGFAVLEVNEEVDYVNMNYKYRFSMGGLSWSQSAKKCTYD